MILKSFVSALPVVGLQTEGELKMRFKINIKKAAKSVSALPEHFDKELQGWR